MDVRVSRLAVASLICATAFYIPIIAGLSAVLLGIAALKAINRSNGTLLGKGLAKIGVGIGAFHALVWALLLFPGASFEVPVGATGVVFREGAPVRALGYGSHHKWPLVESVELYPNDESRGMGAEQVEVLLATAEVVPVQQQGLWVICEPLSFARHFGRRNYLGYAEDVVSQEAWGVVKIAASTTSSVQDLYANSAQEAMKGRLAEVLKPYGICLKSYLVTAAT